MMPEQDDIFSQIGMALEALVGAIGPEEVLGMLVEATLMVQQGGPEQQMPQDPAMMGGPPMEGGMPPPMPQGGGVSGLPQVPGSIAPDRGMMGRRLPPGRQRMAN
ncbi:MAG: hypothetical protein ACK4MQ_00170 [Hyphomonas sp.]